jgi:hypothetical protein
MLLRDLLSKDWNRREWASISRSKSSLSLGANSTAAALPLRVIMTWPSFSHSSIISTEMGFHVRERCDLHNSNSCESAKLDGWLSRLGKLFIHFFLVGEQLLDARALLHALEMRGDVGEA